MSGTDEMADKSAEIYPSSIEGVVRDTWNTYLGAAVVPRGSTPLSEAVESGENQVEARILIRGDAAWEVTLRGSWNSAEEATRRMLGPSSDQVGGDGGIAGTPEHVLDAWGELVNTLAGNLKTCLELAAHHLSIPEVFRDPPAPAATHEATELSFQWDGYSTTVRIARITLA